MRRFLVLAAAGAVALLMLPAAPASATPPSGVHFDVHTTIPPEGGPTSGPFTASGPAVDDGLICSSGDTIDVFGKASGFSPAGVNFQLVKSFTCDDGSGEFLVKLQVRIDAKGDNFNWVIVGGTGAYEDLHGAGSGVGYHHHHHHHHPLCGPDCVHDVYDGGVHIDP